MKAARQVSLDFYGMIEAYKRFKDAQVLFLESPLNDVNLFQASHQIWRGVRIDVEKLRGQAWKIPNVILNNVQFVCLCTVELHSAPAVIDIRNVLNTTPKISHLHLPLELLLSNLNVVLGCPYVQENLKNLKRLDILGRKSHCNSNNGLSLFTMRKWEQFTYILANFEHLASILQRLESLHIPTMRILQQQQQRQIETIIQKLVQRNCETLRELSLHLRFWEQDDISAVKFPRLKTLTVSVKRTDQGALKNFLANQDTLEELDVAVKKEFGNDLLDFIKRRCCPNLKKLHLKAKRFFDFVGGSEQIMDWTFLGKMTRLRDFQLTRPYYYTENWEIYGNGTRLFESLPRNQLKRLCFRGIGHNDWHDCAFWRLNDWEGEPELPVKLDILRGFRNLTHLSFYRCPDVVDDDIMQFVISEMTSLEEFEVSHCSRLTDAGIAGTNEDGSDSIRNLKGQLSKFKVLIKSCLC